MLIDISMQLAAGSGIRVPSVQHLAGSAFALEIHGVPAAIAGDNVEAVSATVVNADGEIMTAPAAKIAGDVWAVTLPASHFSSYGRVGNGLRISITLASGAVVFVIRDFEVAASSSGTPEGDATRSLARKGDDIYVKTSVVDGVQHFARQIVVYNERLQSYAADWTGDYILVNGEFQEVQQ